MKDRLNEIIERKGLTATRFAAMIDVNPSAVSHLLKGRNKPGYDVLVNIARAFPEISMDWLLTGKGGMYTEKTDSSVTPVRPEPQALENKPDPRQREVQKDRATVLPPEAAAVLSSANQTKVLKRIVLFFSDGSFEDYQKG